MPRPLDRTPTQAEVVLETIDARLRELHVAMPGVVKEYDAGTRTATVKPQTLRGIPADDGSWALEDLPVIYDVPVMMPRCGGFHLTFPVRVGDTVLLLFADRDLSTWRKRADVVDPGDQRAHGLSGAVALVGLFPDSGMGNAASGSMTLGAAGGIGITITTSQMQVGGNSDAAALASKVDALAHALSTHTHTGVTTGSGTSGSSAALTGYVSPWTAASAKLKVGS